MTVIELNKPLRTLYDFDTIVVTISKDGLTLYNVYDVKNKRKNGTFGVIIPTTCYNVDKYSEDIQSITPNLVDCMYYEVLKEINNSIKTKRIPDDNKHYVLGVDSVKGYFREEFKLKAKSTRAPRKTTRKPTTRRTASRRTTRRA